MDFRWYESFFQGVVVEMWRKAMPPEQTRLEADFLARALRLQPGDRVLDVPCGAGRHALELASRGFAVTGVDLSKEQIDLARAGAASSGLNVDWRQADMRDLPWRSEFDAACCFGNSFGYIEPAGLREFVGAISRALKPGARFVLDSGMTAESILPNLVEREWSKVDDILFLEENRYHAVDGCLETTYTFVRRGETHTRTGLHWVYTLREIRALLSEAGLIAEDPVSSLDGAPFQAGSRYLILVSAKA
ncbi:MAG TPA: class I SAM-dependent methyltransferase [Candidatus Polarisedimenticolia bacterium]|jgi:cyclopropane fatty-acyl-phospholipid synthase-like methyltransferase|nr:class I SAM-dependent methyltransferase [Candidatus Polarisedimenticolia bacterium]